MVVHVYDMVRGLPVCCLWTGSVAGVVDAFGKLLSLRRQGLETGGFVDCMLAGFVKHGMHQSRAYDDTVRIRSDTSPLFRGGHADAYARVFRTGLAGTGDQFLRGRIDGGAFSGDAHAGGRVHEATIDASPELLVERTRQAGAENVCVGIGVSTAEQGAKVGSYADGVIVGSALVHTLLADDNKTARDPKEGLKLLAAKSEELAEGIHNAR